eukprot:c7243_g1_i1.p1 GENE.c7243_g1_i1~~c7243_g1_i1.p1  ORF type:complete len:209 (+),score=37.14 c7243_g1_i1:31-627(+)
MSSHRLTALCNLVVVAVVFSLTIVGVTTPLFIVECLSTKASFFSHALELRKENKTSSYSYSSNFIKTHYYTIYEDRHKFQANVALDIVVLLITVSYVILICTSFGPRFPRDRYLFWVISSVLIVLFLLGAAGAISDSYSYDPAQIQQELCEGSETKRTVGGALAAQFTGFMFGLVSLVIAISPLCCRPSTNSLDYRAQ